MKILDIPKSGKCSRVVAFKSRFGLCLRQLVIPHNTITPARRFMRGAFGHHSQVYSRTLTDEQMDRWILAGAQVMSDPRLGQDGPLSGQQLYTSINSVRSRVDLPETLEPPVPVAFGPSAVGELVSENTEAGVRLRLRITGELNEDVMVFGQEPCSSGRRKRRNVAYLGLLPPPVDGMSDITYLYRARYGEPRPGTRVFIVTCQQKNGWKGMDRETSALVPDRPQGQQAAATGALTLQPDMHKGGTRDEQGSGPQVVPEVPASSKPGAGPVKDSFEGGASQEQSMGEACPGPVPEQGG
jgi:hypothetical protein